VAPSNQVPTLIGCKFLKSDSESTTTPGQQELNSLLPYPNAPPARRMGGLFPDDITEATLGGGRGA
jgi:hypothetical protein